MNTRMKNQTQRTELEISNDTYLHTKSTKGGDI